MSIAPGSAQQPRRRKPWLVLLALGAAGYATVIVVLMLLETRLLYNACPEKDAPPLPSNVQAEDLWLPSADGLHIHARWFPRPGAPGAVLYCHGKSGNLSHRTRFVLNIMEALQQSVLIFDYPSFGRSEGGPTEAGCYAAADAGYDWLVSQVPAGRILILGESLGGGVAVDLASRRSHRALALAKTFSSLPEVAQNQYFFFPARWLVRNRFENLLKIPRCPGPVFIAHGDSDHLIPLGQSRRLFEAAPEPKRFFRYYRRAMRVG